VDDHEITTFVRSLLRQQAKKPHAYFRTLMTLRFWKNPCLFGRGYKKVDRSWSTRLLTSLFRFERSPSGAPNGGANPRIRGVPIPKERDVSCIVSSAKRTKEFLRNANYL